MDKEHFFELLHKYHSGEINSEEHKSLLRFYESFQETTNWDESLGSKEELQSKMLKRLENDLASTDQRVVTIKRFYSTTIFKLAVAASVAVLIAIPILFNNNTTNAKDNPSIVVKNNIKIGTDKAILTLEDGSVVALEKGKEYTNSNIKSNGEELVYNSKNKISKIANNFLTVPRGGQFFIQLADGTKVWLNSESQLKYPVAFVDGQTRQVELMYGEAYFEVSPSTQHKGSGFKVKTVSQNVEVVGTEFNIKAYKGEKNIYTTLVKGKVQVSNEATKQFLSPNQQSNLNLENKSINVVTVDVYNEISWKKGLFVFDGLPLKDIMKVLSRWYDVDIEITEVQVGNVKFNGVLDKNQNLNEILTTIKATNCIHDFEINKSKITIK